VDPTLKLARIEGERGEKSKGEGKKLLLLFPIIWSSALRKRERRGGERGSSGRSAEARLPSFRGGTTTSGRARKRNKKNCKGEKRKRRAFSFHGHFLHLLSTLICGSSALKRRGGRGKREGVWREKKKRKDGDIPGSRGVSTFVLSLGNAPAGEGEWGGGGEGKKIQGKGKEKKRKKGTESA